MRVSIVIPSFNEAKDIRKCLNAFTKQTRKPLEIIVVDGGSKDETVEVVKEFAVRNKNIRLLHENKQRSPANARNMGWKAALGQIIVFKDADAIVERDYVKKIEEEFAETQARVIEFKEDRFLPEDANAVETALFYKEATIVGYGEIVMKKKVLEEIGGFEPALGFGEDRVMAEKLKKKGMRKAKRTLKIACGRISGMRELAIRNVWYGRTIPKYLQKKQDAKVTATALLSAIYFISLVCIITIPVFAMLTMLLFARGILVSINAFKKSKKNAVFLNPFLELIRVFFMGMGLLYGLLLIATKRYYAGR
ncbi:glycosyltransferase [Candidatus Micrarchaeota archaeon]|nr:glycosyltransferase [Candidatus Micrarchaeota archaeon]